MTIRLLELLRASGGGRYHRLFYDLVRSSEGHDHFQHAVIGPCSHASQVFTPAHKSLWGVKATCTSASGSCRFGSGRAAPSLRGVRALWRVRGRAARSGGRAWGACWSPVTSKGHGSGCSRCCGLMRAHCALLLVLAGCCSLRAPTHTREYAHAASVPEVRRRRDGRLDRQSRVQCAVWCLLLCFVALWVLCIAGSRCACCGGRAVHGVGSDVACSRAEAGRCVRVAC